MKFVACKTSEGLKSSTFRSKAALERQLIQLPSILLVRSAKPDLPGKIGALKIVKEIQQALVQANKLRLNSMY